MNFDLNIENYNKNELMEMFDLPSNYDKNIVEMKELRLRENILHDKNIDNNTRDLTIQFLVKAKNILLTENAANNNSNNNNDNNNSLISGVNQTNKILTNIEKTYSTDLLLKKVALESPEQHMVQEKAKTPFILSYPSDFFPGTLNPLKRRTRKENLVIDTRFRESYYNSSPTNFNFQLPMVIENVVDMTLSAIELPTTYYIISKQYSNNFFSIIVNGVGKVVTIPDGNYDYTSLQAIINNQIFILGDNFQYVNFVINVSSNNGTGQMMVGLDSQTPTGLIETLELNFQADRYGYEDNNTPLTLKLGWVMGFRNGIYTNNLNYVSEAIVDVTGPKYLYLVIDDFNNSNNNGLFYAAFNSSLLNKNIISRISLQSDKFNILLQNNLGIINIPREYFGPVNIRNFQIQLLDEYGRVVDLNYMDFSFCLTMTISYNI
jgi:hypothetical protein